MHQTNPSMLTLLSGNFSTYREIPTLSSPRNNMPSARLISNHNNILTRENQHHVEFSTIQEKTPHGNKKAHSKTPVRVGTKKSNKENFNPSSMVKTVKEKSAP